MGHIVDHDIEHAHTIAHEVSHHDHGTVDIGVVREVSGPTPPALSTPGLGYEFYVPSHFAYDGHQIVIDGTAYDGSHCTHGGYVYDGRFVDGTPLLSAYPVGHGIYEGHSVFSGGVNFNGQTSSSEELHMALVEFLTEASFTTDLALMES